MEINTSPLEGKNNLLAFSAGVDSTALFFLLMDNGIPFDIAIVNYNQRAQSKDEIAYAKELAKKYHKNIYIKEAQPIEKNFEHEARKIRYDFFEQIIKDKKYDNLITAHQLNDTFEWFMMQLSRGSGLNELLGFEPVMKKSGYIIVKPLLYLLKEQLLSYLDKNGYKYYIDQTNSDEKYKRNYFRNRYTNEFLNEFSSGVKNSFKYLDYDKVVLNNLYTLIYERNFFKILIFDEGLKSFLSAKILKDFGYVMSAPQRKELQKSDSIVIGGKFAVGSYKNLLFICKYSDFVMDKKQKEICRVAKIPKHCRPYLCQEGFDLNFITKLIQQHTTNRS